MISSSRRFGQCLWRASKTVSVASPVAGPRKKRRREDKTAMAFGSPWEELESSPALAFSRSLELAWKDCGISSCRDVKGSQRNSREMILRERSGLSARSSHSRSLEASQHNSRNSVSCGMMTPHRVLFTSARASRSEGRETKDAIASRMLQRKRHHDDKERRHTAFAKSR
jgi:hypothetical protein